jgi:hypothetical protein
MPAEPHPVLGRLAAELHRRGWPAELARPPDRNPHVLVHGGASARICERVFATETGGLFIPGIHPHLATARGNVRTAADRLIWILRACASHEHPAEIILEIQDLTALQRALDKLGHHGEVIIPPPYLSLSPDQDGPASEIDCRLLQFCWADLELGDRRHVPAVAETIAWALHAGSMGPPGPPSPPAHDAGPRPPGLPGRCLELATAGYWRLRRSRR